MRDAVWDHFHGYGRREPHGEIDVVWRDREHQDEAIDLSMEHDLRLRMPNLKWSVKNQARMHYCNGDAPYLSVAYAMKHWPETAAAVAARIGTEGTIEINAPLGTADLFDMRLTPTAGFAVRKRCLFDGRVCRSWMRRYPLLNRPTG